MNISSISGQSAAPIEPKAATKADDKDAPQIAAATVTPPAKDTLQAGSAAQKMLQETTETAAQTMQEAGKGDAQAKRLLAKEDAAKSDSHANAPSPLQKAKGENVDVHA